MSSYGILAYLKFNNKNDINKFKTSYDVNTDNIKIHCAQYEKENGAYALDAYLSSNNINDIIEWLYTFNGNMVDILEIDIDPDDNELTKLEFDKTCYSIKVNFIDIINETLINTNNNVISYKINDKNLDICIIYNSIKDCLDWLKELGTIDNKLHIRKLNLD
jgi:hypothetical protein